MIKDIFEATVAIVILIGGVSVLAVIMILLMKVTAWLLSDDKGDNDGADKTN